MILTVDAVYDGKVFLPVHPLSIKPHTRLKISVISDDEPASFLEVARSLELSGPPDWSVKLDQYLYGGEKNDEV